MGVVVTAQRRWDRNTVAPGSGAAVGLPAVASALARPPAVSSGANGGEWVHPSGIIVPAGMPNPTNTGWAGAGATWEDLTDMTHITSVGAAESGTPGNETVYYRGKWVNYDVRVKSDAHDIIFRQCDFWSVGDWGSYLEPGSTRITFEDCTFHAMTSEDDMPIGGNPDNPRSGGIWSAGCTDWTVRRCHFYWLPGGVYSNGSGCTIEDSYFADFTYWSGAYFAPNGDHTNAAGPAGGSSSNQTYRGNTMLMIRPPNVDRGRPDWEVFSQTSCINFAQDDPAAYDNMLVDGNFFVGNQGGHMILGYEPGKGGAPGTNFRVTNNVHSSFGTSSPPRAGYHGQPTWNQGPANNVWSNNVWVDESNVVQGTLAPITD